MEDHLTSWCHLCYEVTGDTEPKYHSGAPAFHANSSSELTSGREQSRRSRQIVGMMDGPEETGAWRTAQELRFQPEVQLVWVRLHLFLKQEEGERMKPGEQLSAIGD